MRPILEYPSDASCCTLRFESLNLTIEIDSQNWVLEPIIPMGLSDFIKKAEEALVNWMIQMHPLPLVCLPKAMCHVGTKADLKK